MRRFIISGTLAALTVLGVCGPALADQWIAAHLRGQVLELIGKQWQPIARNAAVPDGTIVRSLGNGYADFTRGSETVSVSPNTEITIADKAAPGSKPYTTVTEYFGTVAVEADVESVKHFAVDTPYLAAVVKGTRFVVTSGKNGASVTVNRGRVAVTSFADHTHAIISVGQTATVSAQHRSRKPDLVVSGGIQNSSTVGATAASSSEDSGLDDSNAAVTTTTTSTGASDNGKGNGGSNSGNGNSDKSDNGNGNGGVPGNGKGNQAEITLWADWLTILA